MIFYSKFSVFLDNLKFIKETRSYYEIKNKALYEYWLIIIVIFNHCAHFNEYARANNGEFKPCGQ